MGTEAKRRREKTERGEREREREVFICKVKKKILF
jgi:hypothetical protein